MVKFGDKQYSALDQVHLKAKEDLIKGSLLTRRIFMKVNKFEV